LFVRRFVDVSDKVFRRAKRKMHTGSTRQGSDIAAIPAVVCRYHLAFQKTFCKIQNAECTFSGFSAADVSQ